MGGSLCKGLMESSGKGQLISLTLDWLCLSEVTRESALADRREGGGGEYHEWETLRSYPAMRRVSNVFPAWWMTRRRRGDSWKIFVDRAAHGGGSWGKTSRGSVYRKTGVIQPWGRLSVRAWRTVVMQYECCLLGHEMSGEVADRISWDSRRVCLIGFTKSEFNMKWREASGRNVTMQWFVIAIR